MDLQRLFLFLIFSFSLVLVWDGWQRYQHPERFVEQAVATNKDLPTPQTTLTASPVQATSSGSGQENIAMQPASRPAAKTIVVRPDLLEAEISSIGGDISRLALLEHH